MPPPPNNSKPSSTPLKRLPLLVWNAIATAFSGLDTPIQGKGRVELHFITPRVELTTGKSLNIAPPGWGNYFRPWRDYWNESQGWASPDDPQRARTYHPGYDALIDAQNYRLELAGKSIQSREDHS